MCNFCSGTIWFFFDHLELSFDGWIPMILYGIIGSSRY
jgi:hypothetical protein